MSSLRSVHCTHSCLLQYSHLVTKYDRTGYQTRKRYLLVTNNTIYVHNVSNFKAKERINMGQIKGTFLVHKAN